MKPIVSVQDVIDEMDLLNHELKAFLNTRTGELITLSVEELGQAEDDVDVSDCPAWQQESIEQARQVLDSDEYISLPSAFDIDDYRVMEQFCYTVEDQGICEELLYAITGRGAFRRFKDMIYRLGIQTDWYRFRQKELEKIAVRWLEENGITHTQGTEGA